LVRSSASAVSLPPPPPWTKPSCHGPGDTSSVACSSISDPPISKKGVRKLHFYEAVETNEVPNVKHQKLVDSFSNSEVTEVDVPLGRAVLQNAGAVRTRLPLSAHAHHKPSVNIPPRLNQRRHLTTQSIPSRLENGHSQLAGPWVTLAASESKEEGNDTVYEALVEVTCVSNVAPMRTGAGTGVLSSNTVVPTPPKRMMMHKVTVSPVRVYQSAPDVILANSSSKVGQSGEGHENYSSLQNKEIVGESYGSVSNAMQFEFVISDDALNALMDELESSGTVQMQQQLETLNNDNVSNDTGAAAGLSRQFSRTAESKCTSSEACDENIRRFTYYPLPPRIENVAHVMKTVEAEVTQHRTIQRESECVHHRMQFDPSAALELTIERCAPVRSDHTPAPFGLDNDMVVERLTRSHSVGPDLREGQGLVQGHFSSVSAMDLCTSFKPFSREPATFLQRNYDVAELKGVETNAAFLSAEWSRDSHTSNGSTEELKEIFKSASIKQQVIGKLPVSLSDKSPAPHQHCQHRGLLETAAKQPSEYVSPYATPFTPSKIRTPGKYLYFRPWQDDDDNDELNESNPDESCAFDRQLKGVGASSPVHEGKTGALNPSGIVDAGSTATSNTRSAVRRNRYPCDLVAPGVLLPVQRLLLSTHQMESNISSQPRKPLGQVFTAELAFGVRYVRVPKHCFQFLHQLQSARCVSLELVYRPIPAAWMARYNIRSSSGKIKETRSTHNSKPSAEPGPSVYSWAPFLAWSCCKTTSVTCSANDNYLNASLQTDSTQRRTAFRHPHVLIGVAMNFGDSFGYYLPLPCPLPLWEDEHAAEAVPVPGAGIKVHELHSVRAHQDLPSATINALPASCRELISTFVGFGALLQKCPFLARCTWAPCGLPSSSSLPPAANNSEQVCDGLEQPTNPLFLVSRNWCNSSRRALLLAWRKGGCVEWRLFSDIMRSDRIMKIAVNMKSTLVALRERDIVTEGPIEDPSVAHTLLRQCRPPLFAKSGASFGEFEASLQIPQLPPLVVPVQNVNREGIKINSVCDIPVSEHVARGQKIACFRSVAVFRAMAQLEVQLRSIRMLQLFRNIEMPLLYSAADAEYNGLRLNVQFFSQLRLELQDRQAVIEHYFDSLYGEKFNVSSPFDVANLRRELTATFVDAARQMQRSPASLKAGGSEIGEPEKYIAQVVALNHPLLRLVSEHRSHTRLLPLCSAVLGNRYFDRVRATYNTVGTETGRIIVVSPPLQQVTMKNVLLLLRLHLFCGAPILIFLCSG
jgi:hypothetical protein